MEEKGFLESLIRYGESDYYPFHMPGHKRRDLSELYEKKDRIGEKGVFPNPYSIDITEIDGFDNLHHAEGILKESMEAAAKIYGSSHTYYLVNGSSCGILAAICGLTKRGGKILISRNCHKSAYHALILNQLGPVYLYPEYLKRYGINGGIEEKAVKKALEVGEVDAVLVVSPTYEGIVSDIRAIAGAAHAYGIPLIVDEAHGAHFPFAAGGFPKSALECGADVVIQSLHKTLPSFTQTAVLHIKGNLVNRSEIERYLGIFQSSSPSYLFMASMERCIRFMDGPGRVEMGNYRKRLDRFYERTEQLKYLEVLNQTVCREHSVTDWDMSKVVISTQKICAAVEHRKKNVKKAGIKFGGEWLGRILREQYHLEMEMEAPEYVIAMTSLMDTEEGLNRLVGALTAIDGELERQFDAFGTDNGVDTGRSEWENRIPELAEPEIVMKISDALESKKEKVPFEESAGKISREFVYLYPPGIPVLAPGERIQKKILDRILWYRDMNMSVQGIEDPSLSFIITVADK